MLSRVIGNDAVQKVFGQASLLYAAEAVDAVFGLIQFPLVTRILGATQYGLLALLQSWIAVLGQIFSIQLREVIIKYLTEYLAGKQHDEARAVVKLAYLIDLSLSVVFIVVVFLTAPLGARLFIKSPDAVSLIWLQGVSLLMSASSGVSVAIIMVYDRIGWLSIYNMISSAVLFVALLVALFGGFGLTGVIVAYGVWNLARSIAGLWKATALVHESTGQGWLSAPLRSLLPERRPIFVMLFSMNIDAFRKIALANVDVLVLGLFSSLGLVGVYKLAKQLSGYVGRLSQPIYRLTYPEIARLYGVGDMAAVWAFAGRLSRWMLVALAGGFTAIYFFGEPLILLVFGPEYADAIPLFFIVVTGNLWLVFVFAPGLLLTLGRARDLTIINLVAASVLVVALVALIPPLSGTGAALALVLNQIIWLAAIGWYLTRLPGFSWRSLLGAGADA